MTTRIHLFPDDPNSPWYYTKYHSSSYGLFAVGDSHTVSWGRFKTKAALIAYAREHDTNPFDSPF